MRDFFRGFLKLFALVAGLSFASTAMAEVRIVVLGDSNIAGKGVSRSEAYPAQLEAALKARGLDVSVTNAGVNGDQTTDVLGRLDSAVPDGTRLVIISVGINDVMAGVPRPQMVANFNRIVAQLRARRIEVLAFGPAQRLGAFQGSIEGREDLHVEPPGGPRNKYHLNAAGYAHVVRRTMPIIAPVVTRLAKAR
jgi:hypothetical protein